MSDRPPRDPNDLSLGGIVDEVVSQVRDVLDEADVTSRRSRDMLLEGLRDVLVAVDPASLYRAGPRPADRAPDVEVVDGGRPSDAPRSEGPKPDLKVAEPLEEAGEDAPEPSDASGQAQPTVVTRVVVRKSAPRDGRPRVRLPEGGDWRSLFRGSEPRPYRLTAEKGAVRVQLDGLPADLLAEGDTFDVEARVIQVSARDAAAVVVYDRLG